MTTPTVAEGRHLQRGQDALQRVKDTEWPAGKAGEIREACDYLRWALETYDDVLNRISDPDGVYPELSGDPEAYGKALGKAALDAAEWALLLDLLVPERSDEEGVLGDAV